MTLIWGMAFSAGMLAGTLLMLGVVFLWRHRQRAQGQRNPLSGSLFRSPGQSLKDKIDDLRWDVATYLSLAGMPIPFVFGIYLSFWATKGAAPGVITGALLGTVAIAALALFAWKLWGVLRTLQRMRLGYDAELAAGQELNELLRIGFRVFHDFPVPQRRFNIDHILVGPGGVFAVETKGRSKPRRAAASSPGWEVTYDGETLRFPGRREETPMRQVQAAAEWLRDWLTSAVGERVDVQPVVILPGWYVQRTRSHVIPVLATGEIDSYFARCKSKLDAKMIQIISHQLEQRCRDVAPLAYRTEQEPAMGAA